MKDLGLVGVNPAKTLGIKRNYEDAMAEQPLETEKHTPFRGVSARCNYLAADRPEIQYAAKEICRFLASLTDQGVELKRLGKLREGRRRLVFCYTFQEVEGIDTYSDTD